MLIPQMKPMNWIFLYLMINFILLMMMILMYFFNNKKINKKNQIKNKNFKIWKW